MNCKIYTLVLPRVKTTRLWQFINELCGVLDNALNILGVLAHWEQNIPSSNDNDNDTWPLLYSQRIVHVILALIQLIHTHSCNGQVSYNINHIINIQTN
jgi:hypothetical protein